MFDRYYDELEVGDRRVFRAMTVTEAHIVGFAGLTGDHYVLHTDAEYASRSAFGQRVAHGLLILSLGAGLIPLEPGRVVALLGLEDVRFLAPVFIGDTVHPEMEIVSKTDREPGGLVIVDETILNQRDEAVCKARLRVLVAAAPNET